MLNRRLEDAIPFEWHHHPEFELTLTLNSRGQRFVGNHVGAYDHGDLVLVGPHLPHTWASSHKVDDSKPHVALVFWFRTEWIERLAEGSVEFASIGHLIRSAATGLAFDAALRIRCPIEANSTDPSASRSIHSVRNQKTSATCGLESSTL